MALIYHRIPIRAVKTKVFEAITTQEGVSQWWTSDCVVKPLVGFVNEFRLGQDVHLRMKVVLLQPGRSVDWKCLNQHDTWSGTQVSFVLTEEGEYTFVDLKHSGLMGENEEYASLNYQWAGYLTMLKSFCEAGAVRVGGVKAVAPAAVQAMRS